MGLPARISKRWLESLFDCDLREVYAIASDELDASLACVDLRERRKARRRFNKIMDEVVVRHKKEKNVSTLPEAKKPYRQ